MNTRMMNKDLYYIKFLIIFDYLFFLLWDSLSGQKYLFSNSGLFFVVITIKYFFVCIKFNLYFQYKYVLQHMMNLYVIFVNNVCSKISCYLYTTILIINHFFRIIVF